MDELLDLRIQIQTILERDIAAESVKQDCSKTLEKWFSICTPNFLATFWNDYLQSKPSLNTGVQYNDASFDIPPERVLWWTFSMVNELAEFSYRRIGTDDGNSDCKIQNRLMSRTDFHALIMRTLVISFWNVWSDVLLQMEEKGTMMLDSTTGATINSAPAIIHNRIDASHDLCNSTKLLLTFLAKDSIKLFLMHLNEFLCVRDENTLDRQSRMTLIPTVLFMYLEDATVHRYFLVCLKLESDDDAPIMDVTKGLLGCLIYKYTESPVTLQEFMLALLTKTSVPSKICTFLCRIIPATSIGPILEQLLVVWASTSFISNSSTAIYKSACGLIKELTTRLLESPLSSSLSIDHVEMLLVNALSIVVELSSERLSMTVTMLQTLCEDINDMQVFSSLKGLVESLSTIITSTKVIPQSESSPMENRTNDVSQSGDKTTSDRIIPRKNYMQILEELNLCAVQGAECKFRLSNVLLDLEQCIVMADSIPGFSTSVQGVITALLSVQNIEGEKNLEDEVKRLLLLLAESLPSHTFRSLSSILQDAVPNPNVTKKYVSLDISFSIRLLGILEDLVLRMDELSRAVPAATNSFKVDSSVLNKTKKQEQSRDGKTRIKAPVRLALLQNSTSHIHSRDNMFYVALIEETPSSVLDTAWLVLQYCQSRSLSPARAVQNETKLGVDELQLSSSTSTNRKYLIEEIGENSSVKPMKNVVDVDYGYAILIAQALHTISTALLCLSRSQSTLPAVQQCTFHWAMQIVHFVLDRVLNTGYSSQSVNHILQIISVRRSCFGALLTGIERLTRDVCSDSTESHRVDEKVAINNILDRVLVFAERFMDGEKDAICQKMLVQIIGMILMVSSSKSI